MVTDNGLPVEPSEMDSIPTCCHHWVIQTAVGPVSEGSCLKCGEIKEFKNSIDYETEWTNRRELTRADLGVATDALEDVDEMAG